MDIFSKQDHHLAATGYVYAKESFGQSGYRKRVKNLSGELRKNLIFDWPAYDAHHPK